MISWIPDDPILCVDSIVYDDSLCPSMPTVGDKFLKLKDETVNEVAGYQFATSLGVRTPVANAFVARSPYTGFNPAAGAVGMLINRLRLEENVDKYDELGSSTGDELVRFALFFAFETAEGPELWRCNQELYVLDLEKMFPFFQQDVNLDERIEGYIQNTRSRIEWLAEPLRKRGLFDRFLNKMEEVNEQSLFDFHPVRNSELIEQFFRKSLRSRVNRVLSESSEI